MVAGVSLRNPGEDWQRLSAWAIPHFVLSRMAKSAQALLFGVPAGFGVSQTRFAELVWQIPLVIGIVVCLAAVLQFAFTRYRITDSAVEMQRGALFRRRVNLTFERIQNVSIVEPFYFRPLSVANLTIDSAGSAKDEIVIAALPLAAAEQMRSYISTMRAGGVRREPAAALGMPAATRHAPAEAATETAGSIGERFFSRSLRDLVIHGLTNNRAFLAVAGIMGLFLQSGISTADIIDYLGIDFDVVIAGLSLVRFAILLGLALILSIGLLALLSVLVSIVSYFGFSMYRSGRRLIVRRGLLNKHEIAVRKSRIQSIKLSQDWLDYLLDRRNLYLEQLTHAAHGPERINKHVIVPSVRLVETQIVTDEIWPLEAVERIEFTPLSWRYFRKWSLVVSILNVSAIVFLALLDDVHPGVVAAAIAAWPAQIALVYMTWRRGGLAVVGDMIVARSGTIGIDYRLFPASRLQDVAHIQTPFMRRHDVSSLVFMTASSAIKVPYLPGEFARQVVDFSLYDVESRPRSWM